MRRLKKILLLSVLICCLTLLTSCDYSYFLYNNTDGEELFLEKKVTSIELINYENLKVQDNQSDECQLDLAKLEILETLDDDNYENFIKELAEIGGFTGKLKQLLKSPEGIGIRIIYDDDSFTLITTTTVNDYDCIFLGEYNSDEKLDMSFGISWIEMIDDFKVLINKYFTILNS